MANFTDICPDTLNLTCRPWDNLTLRKELERQCHIQLLVLLVIAFATGCLLIATIRIINKYWCRLRRRRARYSVSQRRTNRSDHFVTSIMGGVAPPRALPQGEMPAYQEEILL